MFNNSHDYVITYDITFFLCSEKIFYLRLLSQRLPQAFRFIQVTFFLKKTFEVTSLARSRFRSRGEKIVCGLVVLWVCRQDLVNNCIFSLKMNDINRVKFSQQSTPLSYSIVGIGNFE